MRNKKGFTLIEMLVVIALIGILASLAMISFGNSQKQARDAQRRSDLKQYQTLLESYANEAGGFYPARTTQTTMTTLCSDLNSQFEPDTSCSFDPKDEDPYVYYYVTDGTAGNDDATRYFFWSRLESPGTTTYWVVCSNGQAGEFLGTISPTGANCPI